MPRHNRIKHFTFIYHVMVRSISEVPLFKDDDDKDKYLFYIQKYQKEFGFKVYGYCLMTTHGHFIIDANGADISKVMHGINLSYATYYNVRHKRHGHLFQDRFKSEAKECRALCVFLVRYYCDFTYKQICSLIGRLTLTRISELSQVGLQLIEGDGRYKNIMEEFIKYRAA